MDAGALVSLVVGIDPGFAALGVVLAELPRGIESPIFTKVGVMSTSKCKDLSAGQDLISRASDLELDLSHFVDEGYDTTDVYGVAVEAFSRPPNVGSAIKLGASHGVIAALISRWQPDVVYVEQPQHIRKRVMNIAKGKAPPEEEVHANLLVNYPELGRLLEGRRKADRPHILDAAAAVVAAFREGRLS